MTPTVPKVLPPELALRQAVAHHQAGRLQEAESLYRAVLRAQPYHPDANHNLGVLAGQVGQAAAGLPHLKIALAVDPARGQYVMSYAEALLETGQAQEALTIIESAMQRGLKSPEAQALRQKAETAARNGTLKSAAPAANEIDRIFALFNARRLEEAESQARLLVGRYPNSGIAWDMLGASLRKQGKDALAVLQKAAELLPEEPVVHYNLGNALQDLGELDKAAVNYRRALGIKADFAEAHYNLGNVLRDLGQFDDAVASYRRALELKPDYATACNNLGNVLKEQGQLDAAVASFRRALELRPDYATAHNNLGNVLQELGQLDEAVASYRRALEIKPDYGDAFDNLLFTLNYHADKSAEEIFTAYREYDERFGLPHRGAWRDHRNDREPARRLKVGYVSPDFCLHSARHVVEPLLAHHDKSAVEVFAYAELRREDAVTARYRGYVDHWVTTVDLSDDALAERIRADHIDILVDLAGHTARNRLEVFARKPAPVSVSWLGYGYTTGLTAVDYMLIDEAYAPAGSDALFSETLWRVPTPVYAYRPAEGMGEVSALPAAACGHVTFGTLTRAIRINHRTIRVWSQILQRVEGARLRFDSKSFQDAAMQAALAGKFAAHGIDRARLQFGYTSPPWDVVRGLDISLDCFPHSSGVTLFESLYLGVPFVSLADRPSVGRLGSSLLRGAGHPEWIAQTEEEYVEKAVALASDLPRLADLRAGLRAQIESSPLMDEAGFARKTEAAYRQMFANWARK